MNIKRKLNEYRRIIKIARKPTIEEFRTILKITGAGVVLIGLIGFVIQLIIGAIV